MSFRAFAERMINDSQSAWTIGRPEFLNDQESAARYRVITNMAGITSGDISRADVAHFMLSSLQGESYVGSTLLISN